MINAELKRLNIELSAHCSYACVGCPNTYMERKKGNMSFESFRKIYDEIEDNVQKVFLWNYGEPLLNPNIAEIVLYTRDKRPRTALSTTGRILSILNDVSFLGVLDELIISINGFDSETYLFHQKNGNLSKVIDGLERIKPLMAASATQYVLQVVLNSRNIHLIDEAETFAKKHGFKKVVFKSFNVMGGGRETEGRFVPKEPGFARYRTPNDTKANYPCLESMVINWNGDANICCWDYEGRTIIGNVLNQGVLGVWESETMQTLKAKLPENKILPYCGQCNAKTIIRELVTE